MQSSSQTLLKIGVSIRDITPGKPSWQAGYAARDQKSNAISEPLSITCLCLQNKTETILFFVCDLLGIQRAEIEILTKAISKTTGLAEKQIFISSTHTHFAPYLGVLYLTGPASGLQEPDSSYTDEFKKRMIEAAVESMRSTVETRIETVRVKAPQVAFNRRTFDNNNHVTTNFLYPANSAEWNFSPFDDEITALRFVDALGVRAMLVNYGCHPVTGGPNHYAMSADYPYYVRKYLSDHYHCPVLFNLGSAGDVVPQDRYLDSRQRIGRLIAESIILAERKFQPDSSNELAVQLDFLDTKTIFKVNPDTAKSEYESTRKELLAQLKNDTLDKNSSEHKQAKAQYANSVHRYYRSRLYPENTFKIPLHNLRIGNTLFAGMPFEVLSEISLKLKAAFPNAVLSSMSGGYEGYLAPAAEFERGGYETTPGSHFEIGIADKILEYTLANIAKL